MGRPFPTISCVLCGKPVDLSVDLSADENGKAVHDRCYINRMVRPKPAGIWKSLRLRLQQSRPALRGSARLIVRFRTVKKSNRVSEPYCEAQQGRTEAQING
jgi:hypothetical protein